MARPIKLNDTDIEKILADLKTQLQNSRNYSNTVLKIGNKSGKTEQRPIVDFDGIAWIKFNTLVNQCSVECAWHGTVTRDGLRFTVHDIICYPQTISGATVNTDETKYEAWHQSLDDVTYNTIRLQGHSHVNFSTSPSSVDKTMYEKMLETLSADSWYIFMIANKKGDMWFEIHDIANNIIYENTDIDICVEDNYLKEWYTEQKKMFSEHAFKSNTTICNTSTYLKNKFTKPTLDDTIPGFDDEPPYGYTDKEFKDPFFADDGKNFMKNSMPIKKSKKSKKG